MAVKETEKLMESFKVLFPLESEKKEIKNSLDEKEKQKRNLAIFNKIFLSMSIIVSIILNIHFVHSANSINSNFSALFYFFSFSIWINFAFIVLFITIASFLYQYIFKKFSYTNGVVKFVYTLFCLFIFATVIPNPVTNIKHAIEYNETKMSQQIEQFDKFLKEHKGDKEAERKEIQKEREFLGMDEDPNQTKHINYFKMFKSILTPGTFENTVMFSNDTKKIDEQMNKMNTLNSYMAEKFIEK